MQKISKARKIAQNQIDRACVKHYYDRRRMKSHDTLLITAELTDNLRGGI
ncbi:MAG: hypothetical protein K0R08_294 [Solimicrobium sp.]|jgi:hypothetical protein|nr:hypothetical protein [Solimicrobium sp.]